MPNRRSILKLNCHHSAESPLPSPYPKNVALTLAHQISKRAEGPDLLAVRPLIEDPLDGVDGRPRNVAEKETPAGCPADVGNRFDR